MGAGVTCARRKVPGYVIRESTQHLSPRAETQGETPRPDDGNGTPRIVLRDGGEVVARR